MVQPRLHPAASSNPGLVRRLAAGCAQARRSTARPTAARDAHRREKSPVRGQVVMGKSLVSPGTGCQVSAYSRQSERRSKPSRSPEFPSALGMTGGRVTCNRLQSGPPSPPMPPLAAGGTGDLPGRLSRRCATLPHARQRARPRPGKTPAAHYLILVFPALRSRRSTSCIGSIHRGWYAYARDDPADSGVQEKPG